MAGPKLPGSVFKSSSYNVTSLHELFCMWFCQIVSLSLNHWKKQQQSTWDVLWQKITQIITSIPVIGFFEWAPAFSNTHTQLVGLPFRTLSSPDLYWASITSWVFHSKKSKRLLPLSRRSLLNLNRLESSKIYFQLYSETFLISFETSPRAIIWRIVKHWVSFVSV